MFCATCGAKREEGGKFCEVCGTGFGVPNSGTVYGSDNRNAYNTANNQSYGSVNNRTYDDVNNMGSSARYNQPTASTRPYTQYPSGQVYTRPDSRRISRKQHNNRRIAAIVGILGVVLITILIVSLSGGGGVDSLVGTWEYVWGSDSGGVVVEFTRNTFRETYFYAEDDWIYRTREGPYSISGDEIHIVFDGVPYKWHYQIVGDNLVIDDIGWIRVFNRVRGGNTSFNIADYREGLPWGAAPEIPLEEDPDVGIPLP